MLGGYGCRLLDNGKLRIQGAGHIKVKLHGPVEGTIKTVSVKRQAGKWFVCFSVEREAKPWPCSDAEVGIDVGLTRFAVLSDGTPPLDNPRYYRQAQAKLGVAQRRVARRGKGSKRRRKAVQNIPTRQRSCCQSAIRLRSPRIPEDRQSIRLHRRRAFERERTRQRVLAKSVHDAGWSQFLMFLLYQAACAGRQFIQVDSRGTSQTCLCGHRPPKTLADRWHRCPACGLSGNRDFVSSQVILQRARNLPSSANVEDVVSCVA